MKFFTNSVFGVLIVLSSSFSADYRIKTNELNTPLIMFPAKNLSITELCGPVDNEVVQKKVLFPTSTTRSHNLVVTGAPSYSALPSAVSIDFDSNVVSIEDQETGDVVSLGSVVSYDQNTVVFSPTIPSFVYDLGTKIFSMNAQCKYEIRNELVYLVRVDNADNMALEMQDMLYGEKLTTARLAEELTGILQEIGATQDIIAGLKTVIDSQNQVYATLLLEEARLDASILDYESKIFTMEQSLENVDGIAAELDGMRMRRDGLESEINQIEREIQELLAVYKAKKAELEAKSAILGAILDSVQNECQLREVIATIIVPATKEKQGYSIRHLKGEVVPTKLIHVDE